MVSFAQIDQCFFIKYKRAFTSVRQLPTAMSDIMFWSQPMCSSTFVYTPGFLYAIHKHKYKIIRPAYVRAAAHLYTHQAFLQLNTGIN